MATLNMLMNDLNLLLTAAGEQGTALPVNNGIMKIYEAASAREQGEKDFFVLIQDAQSTAPDKSM